MNGYISDIEEQLKNGPSLMDVEKCEIQFQPSIDKETFVKMVNQAKNILNGAIFSKLYHPNGLRPILREIHFLYIAVCALPILRLICIIWNLMTIRFLELLLKA